MPIIPLSLTRRSPSLAKTSSGFVLLLLVSSVLLVRPSEAASSSSSADGEGRVGRAISEAEEQEQAQQAALPDVAAAEEPEQQLQSKPKLSPNIAEFLRQFVLIKTPNGYILGRNQRSDPSLRSTLEEAAAARPRRLSADQNFQLRVRKGFPSSAGASNFQLRVRKAAAQLGRDFQLRVRKSGPSYEERVRKVFPSAESNFQLRVRKAMPMSERNFQLRVRKPFPSAENNFQLRVRRGMMDANNFQLRVRKPFPSAANNFQLRVRKALYGPDSSFQLRVRKAPQQERNFQLRVKKGDDESIAEEEQEDETADQEMRSPSSSTSMQDFLDRFHLMRSPDGFYFLQQQDSQKRDSEGVDFMNDVDNSEVEEMK